jgi:hypothetical protein
MNDDDDEILNECLDKLFISIQASIVEYSQRCEELTHDFWAQDGARWNRFGRASVWPYIRRAQGPAPPRPKVDDFVPQTQHVNL